MSHGEPVGCGWRIESLEHVLSIGMVQAGDVLLNGLRVNQLKLSRSLAGSLQVSDKEVHMHAKVRHAYLKRCYHAGWTFRHALLVLTRVMVDLSSRPGCKPWTALLTLLFLTHAIRLISWLQQCNFSLSCGNLGTGRCGWNTSFLRNYYLYLLKVLIRLCLLQFPMILLVPFFSKRKTYLTAYA